MPRAPLKEVGMEQGADYAAAFRALNRMVDAGRSWSGYERNRCFLNTGKLRFADVSANSGLDFLDDARTTVSVDWDHDGDLDLFQINRTAPQLRYLRNDWNNGSHWLALRLVGTSCNRDAVGARIELFRSGNSKKDVRTLRAGNAFLSQSTKWVHFGLANNSAIQRVVVKWPGGEAETFSKLTANNRYRLVQGTGNAIPVSRKPSGAELTATVPKIPKETEQLRAVLRARLPLSALHYRTYSGTPSNVDWGQPTLVQLWASWCPMCRADMLEFKKRADELRRRVRVVALSVDGIGDDDSNLKAASDAARQRQYPFSAGTATSELLERLEILRSELFSNSRPFPVPTNFLVDAEGRLSVIYVGPLKVDQLLRDVTNLSVSDERQRELSAPVSGRWISTPNPIRLAPIAKAFRTAGYGADADWYQQQAAPQMALSHCQLALESEKRNDLQTATAHYQQALKLAPKSARVHCRFGSFHLRQRRFELASKSFETAIELEPDLAEPYYRLAMLSLFRNQHGDAKERLTKAIQVDAQYAMAHTALARILQAEKKWDEALGHLLTSVKIDPDYAPTHVYLGVALLQRKQLNEAAERFRRATTLNPDLADAQAHLANVLASQGKTGEAAIHYRRALRLTPNSDGVALKLAWCLATCHDDDIRSGTEAVTLAERAAAATKRRQPGVLDVLAAAYAEVGEFAKALATIGEALELAKADARMTKLLEQRRQLYLKKQPIRSGRKLK